MVLVLHEKPALFANCTALGAGELLPVGSVRAEKASLTAVLLLVYAVTRKPVGDEILYCAVRFVMTAPASTARQVGSEKKYCHGYLKDVWGNKPTFAESFSPAAKTHCWKDPSSGCPLTNLIWFPK